MNNRNMWKHGNAMRSASAHTKEYKEVLMKNFTKKAAVAFCAVSMLLTAGCTKKTDDTPVVDTSEGFVTIEFYYDSQTRGEAEYIKLIDTYNQTQGQTDKVVVIGTPVPGITNSAQSHMMRDNAPNVITVGDKSFKSLAVQNGLMLSLEDYAKDSGVTDDMPAELVNRFRFTSDTMEAGAGAELLGVPNGNAPKMFYYNAGYFKQQEINIISVSEQNLDAYNKENGTGFMPHGYAEYAAENAEVKAWADAAGLVVSTNLAGDEVYKVFNEQIPTNWEELRYLSKCFTQTYNSSSPSKFGFMTEWWFPFGWSVGGDCIGYNGEQYEFTILDDTPNYLVTANETTVNGRTYQQGEIVSYEDKVNDPTVATNKDLYPIKSQYDAFLEFNRYTKTRSDIVDEKTIDGVKKTYYGYAITDAGSLSNRDGEFMAGNAAILAGEYTLCNTLKASGLADWDVAPEVQYREYVGGSVYYKDGTDDFSDEYLKVIGKTYDGVMYNGELHTENGTPVVGLRAVNSIAEAYAIPTRSDPAKYDAAWKFISWASGPEGQLILSECNLCVPNQISLAVSDGFVNNENRIVDNLAAVGASVVEGRIGDWGYFEEGSWVTAWANVLNGSVRAGTMTLSEFYQQTLDAANAALAKKEIVIRR